MERKTLVVSKNAISEELKRSTKTRWITAIIAILMVLPVIFLGEWPMFVFIIAVLGICIWEILHCTGQKYPPDVYVFMYLFAFLLTFWPIIRGFISACGNGFTNWTLYFEFDSIYLSVFVLAAMLFFFFFIVVLHSYFTVRDACFFFTMVVFISLGLQGIMYIKYAPLYFTRYILNDPAPYFSVYNCFQSTILFIFVCLSSFINDAGAYFVGIYFGKHKMNPRISPKKTWEGFFGGIIIGTAICFTFGMIFAAVGLPMLPAYNGSSVFDIQHWYNILLLSITLPLLGTLGDFVFSSIKRYYEIKDFGHIMPGHGGVLDRLDSLIFVFVAAAIIVSMITRFSLGVNFLL